MDRMQVQRDSLAMAGLMMTLSLTLPYLRFHGLSSPRRNKRSDPSCAAISLCREFLFGREWFGGSHICQAGPEFAM